MRQISGSSEEQGFANCGEQKRVRAKELFQESGENADGASVDGLVWCQQAEWREDRPVEGVGHAEV